MENLLIKNTIAFLPFLIYSTTDSFRMIPMWKMCGYNMVPSLRVTRMWRDHIPWDPGWKAEADSQLGDQNGLGCAVHTEMNGQVRTGGQLGGRRAQAEKIGMNKSTGSLAGMWGLGSAESTRDSEQRNPELGGTPLKMNLSTQLHSLNDHHHTGQEADLLGLSPGFVTGRAMWPRASPLPLCASVSSSKKWGRNRISQSCCEE